MKKYFYLIAALVIAELNVNALSAYIKNNLNTKLNSTDDVEFLFQPQDVDFEDLVLKYENVSYKDILVSLNAVKVYGDADYVLKLIPEQWKPFLIRREVTPIQYEFLYKYCGELNRITGIHFQLILLDLKEPYLASDSGFVFITTTGFAELSYRKQELLMALLHEVIHQIFVKKTLEHKILFNQAIKSKEYKKAQNELKELAKIEIECDLMATILYKENFKEPNLDEYFLLLRKLEEYQLKSNVNKKTKTPCFHPRAEQRIEAIKKLLQKRYGYQNT